MTAFGVPISRPLNGADAAELASARDARRRRTGRTTTAATAEETDTVEVTSTDAAEAPTGLSDAGDEQARQDSHRSGHGPQSGPDPAAQPKLDVEG